MKDAVFADAAAEDDPYCRLLAEIVMPQLRTAVTNQWQPRDPEPLLRWLEVRSSAPKCFIPPRPCLIVRGQRSSATP